MITEAYDLEMVSPPCDPGSERWSAFVRLRQDIAEVLPYLNTLWRGAIYDHENHVLTMVRGGRRYTLRPYQIAIGNLEDRQEAQRVADRVVREINDTWGRREQIVPNYERRRPPTVLEVFKLLPGGNCKQCGDPTCFVFATKLVAAQADLQRCPRLFEAQFSERARELAQLLGVADS